MNKSSQCTEISTNQDRDSFEHLSVIVPYRDRKEHLDFFIPTINYFLTKTLKHSYDINIIEQHDSNPFNRGSLLNVGFLVLKKIPTYICLHDVDTTPVLDLDPSIYEKPTHPTHLCYGRSTENFQLMYPNFFGGVNLFLYEHFKQINGFSNKYAGWGAEDDDLLYRCIAEKFSIHRRRGLFNQIPHTHGLLNNLNYENNLNHLKTAQNSYTTNKNYLKDGLTSIKYKINSTTNINNTTTHFLIDFL